MQQRLRLLAHTLESVDESVVISSPEDRIVFVNRAFERTYGYEERELVGKHISMVRSPLDAPGSHGGHSARRPWRADGAASCGTAARTARIFWRC